MSTIIDNKVVEMRFDNRHFEKNAQESMSTLDKLKQKLNLTGASKGLENLNTSANKVNMNGLSSALETVHSRFSALEIMGVTALANITNSAVNAGKRIVESLTIAPIKDGWQEYEMTLNAVQTTMAGTGKTAEQVEEQLKRLDEYADKTVYSTADMLNNLPKFTNAGVELEDATTAMIGIANATALAGGDANKASIAFYNLGQAIGTGYLTRMDYNSINNAGIATMEWKEQMVEAAIAAGTLKKVGEDSYKAGNKTLTLQQLFIDGLQEQWATTEVLMKVFQDYGDETTAIGKKAYASAQDIKTFSQMMESLKATAGTGWKDTWQIIFGNLEEAKEFWTGLTNFISGIITGMAKARNTLLESALGKSFTGLLDKIKTSADGVKEVVNSVKNYAKVVDEIIAGKWGNGQKRWDALTEAGYDWAHAQNLVNERLGNSLRRATKYKEGQQETTKTQQKLTEATTEYILELMKLSDAQLKEKGYTDEQIQAFRDLEKAAKQTGIPLKEFLENIDEIDGRYLLINSFKNLGLSLVSVFKSIGAAWKNAFPPMSGDTLFNIIAGFHKFSTIVRGKVEKNADKLTRTLKGLFAILDMISMVIGGGFKIAFTILKTILGMFNMNILDFTAMVGDAIVAVRDWIEKNNLLTKAIKVVVEYIVLAITAIRDWVANNETIAKGIDKIKSSLKSFTKGIQAWFDGLKKTDNIPKYILSGLANGLKAGASVVYDAIINIGKGILDAICKVLGIHSPSVEFFEVGKNIIQGLINGIQNGLSGLWNFIKNIGLTVVNIINGIDFGKLIAAGVGLGMLVVIVKMLNVLNGFAAPLEGLGDMFEGIGQGVKSFGQGIKKWGQAQLIESIAKSIAILAISILLLSRIDPATLWSTVGAIAALAAIIGVLAFAASKVEKVGDLGKLSVMFLGITGSLLILAIAMRTLGKMNAGQLDVALKGLAAMIIGLGALVIVIGKFVKGDAAANIDKVGKMMRKIATALLVLVIVIKIASMMDAGDLVKGIAVVGMLGLLVAGLISIGYLGGEHADKAGKMISKIAFALLIMVGVIKLASMLKAEEVAKGLIVIGAVSVFFAALIAVSNLAGQHAAKAGAMLLMMSLALAITVAVIKQISGLDDNEIKRGMIALGSLGLFFTALIAVSKLAGQHAMRAGAMLLMISAALVILAGVLFVLSKMNMKELYSALGIVTVLELLFTGLIYVSKYAREDSMKTLITLIVGIGILIAAVIGLTFIDPKKLLNAASSLSLLMVSLAGLIASTKLIGATNKGTIKSLSTMVGVVGILAVLVALLSNIEHPKAALVASEAIGVLMLSLSASLIIMSKIGPNATKSIGAMYALTGVVALLATILGTMDHLNVTGSMGTVKALSTLLIVMTGVLAALGLIGMMKTNAYIGVGALALLAVVVAGLAAILVNINGLDISNSMKTVQSLSILLMNMSAALVILGVVGLMGAGAFIGIGALVTLVIAIGGLVAALGWLAKNIKGLEGFIDEGIPILEKIGYALGSFVGNVISGFTTGLTNDLPKIAENLSDFMTKLEPFIAGAKTIDKSIVDNIGALARAILKLTGVDLVQTIASWITGESSLADFGSQLASLGTAMSKFVENLGTFNEAQLTTVDCAGKAITSLADAANKIPGTGGLWQKLVGEQSLAKFGADLPLLGNRIARFVFNLGTFGEAQLTTVKSAGNAILALAEAANKIPGTDGLWQKIVGEKSLAKFGSDLPGLGTHLANFVINLGTFAEDQVTTVDCAGKAITALANAANAIPAKDGLWQKIVGEKSLAAFAGKLPGVGTDLAGFVVNLGTFTKDQTNTVDCAGQAILALANAAKALPPDGGIKQLFTGDNDISAFGDKLPQLGLNLRYFMNGIGTFGPDQINSVKTAVNAIKAIVDLGKIDIGKYGNKLDEFGSKMINFADYVKSFALKIGTISAESITSATEKIKLLVDTIVSVTRSNTSAIEDFGNTLHNIGLEGLQRFVDAFSGVSLLVVRTCGEKLMDTFVSGANFKKTSLTTNFQTLATVAVGALGSKEITSAASQAGTDLTTGFANGIQSKTGMAAVTSAGTAIGKAALAAAKAAIKSNSPSKEAMKIGNYFGQGLVIGIEDYETKTYDAGYGIADRARDGLSRAIAKVSNLISNGIDAQPTIRPVLDLSDIESGAGYINTMFNDPSLGVMSNLNAISYGMNTRNQNGVNSDVVSAINKLRKDLGNVGGTTNNYNVNGVTYDDGSNITDAVRTLVRAAKVERRV